MQVTYISNRNIAFNFKGHQIIFCTANNNIQYLAKNEASGKTMTAVLARLSNAFENLMMIVRRDTRSISIDYSSQNIVNGVIITFNLFEPADVRIMVNLEYRKTVEGVVFGEVCTETDIVPPSIKHYVDVAKNLFTAVFDLETEFVSTYNEVKNA